MKSALVFSAGGMFGAWQAGAWKVCAERFRPDLIVGASIGSLNGWLAAAAGPADELERYWREFGGAGRLRMRIPTRPSAGWFDTREMEQAIRRLHAEVHPKIDYALVITDLMRLKPRIIHGADVTDDHLVASCALPFVFDQPRINGRTYSDGGLLSALPVWAATELGAKRIVALHALPQQPNPVVRVASRAFRGAATWKPEVGSGVEVVRLQPEAPLGGFREMMNWDRGRIESWIRLGEEDARRHIAQNKTFLSEMF